MRKAREHWKHATLICITHDVSDTNDFDRVMVIDSSRLVADGSPQELKQLPNSRYRDLLSADEAARNEFEQQSQWRRLQLNSGQIIENPVEHVVLHGKT